MQGPARGVRFSIVGFGKGSWGVAVPGRQRYGRQKATARWAAGGGSVASRGNMRCVARRIAMACTGTLLNSETCLSTGASGPTRAQVLKGSPSVASLPRAVTACPRRVKRRIPVDRS